MLSYVARMIPYALRARRRRDGALVSRLERRVQLDEIDFNRHMNQAMYARVMEWGRLDLFEELVEALLEDPELPVLELVAALAVALPRHDGHAPLLALAVLVQPIAGLGGGVR